MTTTKQFRDLALAFPGTEEMSHFEKASFRIKKKIFATLDEKKGIVTLKFSEIDQSVFCAYDKTAIYPVPNKWGKQGWTFVDLARVPRKMLLDALDTSYRNALKPPPKKSTRQ